MKKSLTLTIAAVSLLAVSCISTASRVKIGPVTRVEESWYSADITGIIEGIWSVSRGQEEFKPKRSTDSFATVDVRFANCSSEAYLRSSLPAVELLCRVGDGGDLEFFASALDLTPVPKVDYISNPSAFQPQKLEPGNTYTRELAFLLPEKTEILGVTFDRLRSIDIVQAGQPGYDEYLSRLEMEKSISTIFAAARMLNFEVITAMMDESGVDATTKDRRGATLFQQALISGNLSVARGLLAKGADRSAKIEFGYGIPALPIHLAILSGNKELVEWMLSEGFSLVELTPDGRGSFEMALRSGYVAMVRYLVEKGFNPATEKVKMAYSNMKPIAYAKQVGHMEIVDYLSSLGLE